MPKKLTINKMQEIALKRGGWCLSPNYFNNHSKLWWQCKEGHVWESTPLHVCDNTWCPICYDNKIANHLIISNELEDILVGEMLGDGNLTKKSNVSAFYRHSSSKKEYLQWLISQLDSHGLKTTAKIHKENDNEYNKYHFDSLAYRELLLIFDKWYDSKLKVIPDDIKLNPIVVRQWYIGDGSLGRRNGKYISLRPKLCTLGFTITEVNLLRNKLKNIGIYTKMYLDSKYKRKPDSSKGDGYLIYISHKKNVRRFFEYIGDCPKELEDVYGYKWPSKIEYEWLYK